jgi:putative hydrolase of the HAD superfamily
MNITTIVFDIGNVLVDFRWKAYLEGCGYSEDITRKVSNATVMNPRWKKWDRGDIKGEEMIEQCCLEEPKAEREIRRLFTDLRQLVTEFDYAADLIKTLKDNGYKVYLLSNYADSHFNMAKEHFSFIRYVDGGVISYEVNHIKPEPEIYEALIDKYQLDPAKTVFLDDLTDNLEAAKAFGF